MRNKRKMKYVGTALQKRLLLLIFSSAVIPTTIVVFALYYTIFSLMATQMGIPESIAYNLIPVLNKVNLVMIIGLPVIFMIIWFVALELSHRIAGPLLRIEKEIETRISGETKGDIKIRLKDELRPLVEKINRLLKK